MNLAFSEFAPSDRINSRYFNPVLLIVSYCKPLLNNRINRQSRRIKKLQHTFGKRSIAPFLAQKPIVAWNLTPFKAI